MKGENCVKRENWVSLAKLMACIAIVLAHFLQSMLKAGLIQDSAVRQWFNSVIYGCILNLFFLCSGYLYQRNSVVRTPGQWLRNVRKKLVVLGVPFFTFSILTWCMKKIFESSVHTEEGSLTEILFIAPTAPYWFLYTLFFLFLLIPTFKTGRDAVTALGISLLVWWIYQVCWGNAIFLIDTVLGNSIYFIAGMALNYCGWWRKFSFAKWFVSLLFFPVSIWIYRAGGSNIWYTAGTWAASITGCFFIIQTSGLLEERVSPKVFYFSAEYTMPLYLMHTIAAAGIRSLLFKAGIHQQGIHIIVGLAATFVLPVLAAWVAKKMKYPYFFIQPKILLGDRL